ncbi:MAG: hypothetical protein RIT45_2793 [Pseudomonadota bacterium]|jgi:hypothetical protein
MTATRPCSPTHAVWPMLLLLLATPLGGCEILQAVVEASEQAGVDVQQQLEPPEVTTTGVELRRRPGLVSLGAYYCPGLLGGTLGSIGCTLALGAAPAKNSLRFDFGLPLTIANKNDVPVPALDVLVALTLYPEETDHQALGATCISFCGADDPTCTGSPRPDACTVTSGTVKTLDDFVGKLPQLIDGIASGKAAEELQNAQIPAAGDVKLDLVFSMGLDPMLTVLEKTASTWVELYAQGKAPVVEIPVRVEGSVFFELPVVGRIAVDYGPLATTWKLDANALLTTP